MALDENVEYANKINELVRANNELRLEVIRLRNILHDVTNENWWTRLLIVSHLKRRPPDIGGPIRPMDVPPIMVTPIPNRAKRV